MMQFLQSEGAGVREIKTDFGKEFFGDFTTRLSGVGVIVERATPYHKNKNCQVERAFGIMKNILSAVMFESEKSSWVNCLTEANLLYNAIPHSTTGLSPYQIVFGHACREAEYLMQHFDQTEIDDMVALRWDEWSSSNHKEPDVKFEIGDQVLIKRQQASENGMAMKYGQKFIGPFELKDKLNASTFTIDKNGTEIKVNVAQMRMYQERDNKSFLAKKIAGTKLRWEKRKNNFLEAIEYDKDQAKEESAEPGVKKKEESQKKEKNDSMTKQEKSVEIESADADKTIEIKRVLLSDEESRDDHVTWEDMVKTMSEESKELFESLANLNKEDSGEKDQPEKEASEGSTQDFYIGEDKESQDTLGKLKEIGSPDIVDDEPSIEIKQEESEIESIERIELDELSDSDEDRRNEQTRIVGKLLKPMYDMSTPRAGPQTRNKTIGWSPVDPQIMEEATPTAGYRRRLRNQPRKDYVSEKISGL